jgi:hypothetical protein
MHHVDLVASQSTFDILEWLHSSPSYRGYVTLTWISDHVAVGLDRDAHPWRRMASHGLSLTTPYSVTMPSITENPTILSANVMLSRRSADVMLSRPGCGGSVRLEEPILAYTFPER